MGEGSQKLISNYGSFQLRSAVCTPEGYPFSVELVVTLLNVPALKHTACCCRTPLPSAE